MTLNSPFSIGFNCLTKLGRFDGSIFNLGGFTTGPGDDDDDDGGALLMVPFVDDGDGDDDVDVDVDGDDDDDGGALLMVLLQCLAKSDSCY